AGIMYRVLKGPAVAHLDYPDPAHRAFGDVDVLVASSAYDDAMAVLRASGARRRFSEVRPGFDRRWGKGACVVAPDGTQIDVHRTFVAGPFGLTIDLDELLSMPEWLAVGDDILPALDRESRFIHACFHAALGDRVARLVALRDVAQMILAHDLDRDLVMARARRWRAEAVVARGVRLTWARLRLEPVAWSTWAASHRADRFQARALRAYTSESRSYATQTVAGLAAIRTMPEKAAYMHALLVSDGKHLAARDRSYGRRVQRAARAFGATRGPS
ncbi:MAG TPA: nucleotidyltransferase family protein, partial [Acidimicrobiia bacterium]